MISGHSIRELINFFLNICGYPTWCLETLPLPLDFESTSLNTLRV